MDNKQNRREMTQLFQQLEANLELHVFSQKLIAWSVLAPFSFHIDGQVYFNTDQGANEYMTSLAYLLSASE